MKKELYSKGKLLYVTSAFPPVKGGTSVVNGNLLSNFRHSDYIVATVGRKNIATDVNRKNVRILMNKMNIPSIFTLFYERILIRILKRRVKRLIISEDISAIVIVYPSFYLTKAAFDAALSFKIPIFIYLHDTLEPLRKMKWSNKTINRFESDVFTYTQKVFVISEGMKMYYRKKGYDSFTIEHCQNSINLPLKNEDKTDSKIAFWGGAIYGINNKALFRLARALDLLNFQILSTSNIRNNILIDHKVDQIIEQKFYNSYDKYLNVLTSSKFLLLALNHWDETNVPFEELSTIFPTKTIEYLNADVPIIVHCPEEYYLAKFFRKYDCGFVINSHDVNKLKDSILAIDENSILEKNRNAKKAARLFLPEIVASKFHKLINE